MSSLVPYFPCFDCGVYLTHMSFGEDLDDVVQRAVEGGVDHLLVLALNAEISDTATALAGSYGGPLLATVGVHPHETRHCDDDTLQSLRATAHRDHAVGDHAVAVGLTGLDFDRVHSKRSVQETWLEHHLELAADLALPVVVHARDAHDRLIEMIQVRRMDLAGVIAHDFTGTPTELRDYLDLGAHIAISSLITQPRLGAHVRQIAQEVPVDRLLVQSAAPFHPPPEVAEGRPRNEPAWLPAVVELLAQVRGDDPEGLANVLVANAAQVLGLDDVKLRDPTGWVF